MSNQIKIIKQDCKLCGEGKLTTKHMMNEVEYKDHYRRIPLYYSVCDVCQVEQISGSESRRNKKEMTIFKNGIDDMVKVYNVAESIHYSIEFNQDKKKYELHSLVETKFGPIAKNFVCEGELEYCKSIKESL